jgi:hypothetical protein
MDRQEALDAVALNVALCEALGLDASQLQAVTLRIRPGNVPTITACYLVLDHKSAKRLNLRKFELREVSAAAVVLKPARGEE